MKRLLVLAMFLTLILAACAPSQTPAQTPAPTAPVKPTSAPTAVVAPPTAAPTASPVQATPTKAAPVKPAPFAAAALPAQKSTLFAGSGACAPCHTNLKDSKGADASIDIAWRASMHALAARDPYWQATMAAETVANPALKAVIEDKCATCHTPMAQVESKAAGKSGLLLGNGYFDPANAQNALAMDAVSCTLCHQIAPTGFGQAASYSGGFVVDTKAPAGQRQVTGPFPAAADQVTMHAAATGYSIRQGAEITKSELCATCHTLHTPYVNAKGEVAGTFPEQMAYLEWQNSEYAGVKGCADCHMPAAAGAVPIALGGSPRTPVRSHSFLGGNAFMMQMLGAGGASLGLPASSDQLADAATGIKDLLKTSVAAVSLGTAEVKSGKFSMDVKVSPILGHKFPTGFPSRRAWLHVTVIDGAGKVIFESGGYKTDGSIVGNDNDGDASKFEPHYNTITAADQVQIYETIVKDTDGKVTTVLLKGAAYAKDNRLLPPKFDKAKAPADIAVIGEAKDDADFGGAGDTVHYVLDLGAASGKLTVRVELLYQSIGFRWAENLKKIEAAEVTRFAGLFGGVANEPLVVATAERTF